METNSSGDELLKTSSKETNCLETKSRGTIMECAGVSFLAVIFAATIMHCISLMIPYLIDIRVRETGLFVMA